MSEAFSLKETPQGIATLTLNRPDKRNALGIEFWHSFADTLQKLDDTGKTRVLLLLSSGKHFSAGMDVEIFTNPKAIPLQGEASRISENLRRIVQQLQATFTILEQVRFPVLAGIQGGCIGGALDMVAACDSRYCTEDAFFSIKETQLGMTADLGTLQRLPRCMPLGKVKEMAYTGEPLSAKDALHFGLVNQIFPDQATLESGLYAIAEKIAQQSPLAVMGSKVMINYARDHNLSDSLEYMATWQAGMFRPEDMMKSFAAKAQKTHAQYSGLLPRKRPFVQDLE